MRYLRTLLIVWSLVRRRVTRRFTRLQTMYNVIKFRKTLWNNVQTINLQEPQRSRNIHNVSMSWFCYILVAVCFASCVGCMNISSRLIIAKLWPFRYLKINKTNSSFTLFQLCNSSIGWNLRPKIHDYLLTTFFQ